MKRRFALLLVALSVFTGCFFAFRRRSVGEQRDDGVVGSGDSEMAVESSAEVQLVGDEPQDLQRAVLATTPTGGPASGALEGRIVFLDFDEGRRPSSRGSVTWQVESPDGTIAEAKARIRDDRWRLEPAPLSRVKAVAALWSGDGLSQYADIQSDWMTALDAQTNPIVARLKYGCTLRVVDVRTGAELDDVEVALAHKEYGQDTRCPPTEVAARATRHAASPVKLPFGPGIVAGWCRAPGYAWQRFAFTGDRGVHTVALSAGCELTVEVRELPASASPTAVMVYAIEGGELSELGLRLPLARGDLADDGRASFTGLPAGPALLVVGAPNPRPASTRLAERLVELVPGHALTEVIGLGTAGNGLGALRVEVRLLSGPAPNMTRVVLQRVGMERTLPVEHLVARRFDAAHKASIDLPGLAPGHYWVWLAPHNLVARARVAAGESRDVVLAPSQSTSLRVRLSHLGKPISGGVASVAVGPAQVRHVGAYTHLNEGSAPGEYVAACTPGEYVVVAHVPGLAAHSRVVTLEADPVHVDIELEKSRNYVLRASARHGAEELLLPEAYWASVGVLDARTGASPVGVVRKIIAKQSAGLSNMDATTAEFTFQAPGDYTLVLPRPSGMEAPEPVTVTLTTESVHEVPIHFEYE